jgi:predicted RNase H-like nuclease (RuvC/YqgF family)
MIDVKMLSDLASSETLFAVLFLAGLVLVGRYVVQHIRNTEEKSAQRESQLIEIYKEQLDASATREEKLMSHLDKSNEQLEGVADTLKDIQGNLEKLEHRVESNFHDVWKELGGKADRAEVAQTK